MNLNTDDRCMFCAGLLGPDWFLFRVKQGGDLETCSECAPLVRAEGWPALAARSEARRVESEQVVPIALRPPRRPDPVLVAKAIADLGAELTGVERPRQLRR